jgi:hypothetical protein
MLAMMAASRAAAREYQFQDKGGGDELGREWGWRWVRYNRKYKAGSRSRKARMVWWNETKT